ncbi:MAG: hypothetical protein V7K32_25775, partial [Nostoc sp.]|uniref:hypothetical protein n=1 Tax=Nostoc sp. TaxID=1180 RepID=UPI002FF62BB0
FPNSEVKRCCGHDSLGVALRKNSSMPGFLIQLKPSQKMIMRRLLFFLQYTPKTTEKLIF